MEFYTFVVDLWASLSEVAAFYVSGSPWSHIEARESSNKNPPTPLGVNRRVGCVFLAIPVVPPWGLQTPRLEGGEPS